MKLSLCILVGLVLTATAGASVDLFFTSSADVYGLRNPAMAFLPTAGNGTDFRDGYELTKDPGGGEYLNPPIGCPLPDVYIDCNQPDPAWAYIWARFNDEPVDATIIGMALGIEGGGSGVGNIAWYLSDNSADPSYGTHRWDGEVSIFYSNPAGLIAITSDGISNSVADAPGNLFIGGDCRTFLLGAVKVNCPVNLTFDLPTKPIKYEAGVDPEVRICNRVVPEPASLMALGLLGLMVRRR